MATLLAGMSIVCVAIIILYYSGSALELDASGSAGAFSVLTLGNLGEATKVCASGTEGTVLSITCPSGTIIGSVRRAVCVAGNDGCGPVCDACRTGCGSRLPVVFSICATRKQIVYHWQVEAYYGNVTGECNCPAAQAPNPTCYGSAEGSGCHPAGAACFLSSKRPVVLPSGALFYSGPCCAQSQNQV
jgi:hypothetical protein